MSGSRPNPLTLTADDIGKIVNPDELADNPRGDLEKRAPTLKTRVYYLDDASLQLRTTALVCLTQYGTGSDPNPVAWVSWILTYLVVAYPELKDIIRARQSTEYDFVPFPENILTNWVESFNAVDESSTDIAVEIMHLPRMPLLPVVHVTVDIVGSNELKGLYCYAALLMFLCGKSIGPTNRSSITEKRPRALMAEFQTQGSQYILTGPGKMSITAHERVNAAWTLCVDPRVCIVDHFARIAVSPDSTPYRIMSHIMQLLKNSGMNYVTLIVRLLQEVPRAGTLPGLRADLIRFKESAARLYPVNDYLRPYYKMAYGNECKLFRRKEMAGLIAVSITFGAQYSETLLNYRIDHGYSRLLDQFSTLCAEEGITFQRSASQSVITHAL